jgi:S1-C subfamily serine protease
MNNHYFFGLKIKEKIAPHWRYKMKIATRRYIILTGLIVAALFIGGCSWMNGIPTAFADSQPTVIPSATPAAAPTISPQLSGDLQTLQSGFNSVYEQVIPSVVNIQVSQIAAQAASPGMPGMPFDFPFQQPEQQAPYRRSGLGSGFVWDQQGHIVTNNHVVENADEILVTFYDGTSVPAEIVGTDAESDLAIVKVDYPADSLQPIQVADSTQVEIGDLAAAIGNPFGLKGTMTVGIISALGRSLPVSASSFQGSSYTIPDIIQTDAAINPGNSGGVLVDTNGQLIGIPTAIESSSGVNAGIGFVIPSIIVQNVAPALIDQGYYEHPWIGISGTTLNSKIAEEMHLPRDQHGVLVVDVVPGSPSDEAGLRGSDRVVNENDQKMRLGGDIITQIDSHETRDFEDLTAYLARYTSAGQTVTLNILRDGEPQSVELTLEVRPSQRQENMAQDAPANQPRLGIKGITLPSEIAKAMDLPGKQKGVLIQQLLQDSPAEKAGLRGSYKTTTINGEQVLIGGDVIIALNDKDIENIQDLQSALSDFSSGDEITVTILRDGDEMEINVELE